VRDLRRSRAIVASLALTGALVTALPAASAAASPAPRASASAGPERLVVATCDRTPFYVWPARDSVPSGADYPPARSGDAFHIVGTPQLTNDGLILYETTIDVVAPWGAGKHYWVESRCVNAG
jgi:hypothetical protein